MRNVYRVLASLICALVVFQAAMHAWGSAGMGVWISGGGVLDKGTIESGLEGAAAPFPEFVALQLHGLNGLIVVPAIALLLLIVAVFAKVRRGLAHAGVIVGLVVLQVTLGLFGHGIALLGLAHGANALLVFTAAWLAARNASADRQAMPAPEPDVVRETADAAAH